MAAMRSDGIDLPNDDRARDLVRACLAVLARQFSTPAVTIDTSVYNAARIIKLYGTIARKGDATADRPHRRAELEERPSILHIVTEQQLQRLAAARPNDSTKRTTRSGAY